MIREKIINIPPITGINPFNELAIDAEIWRQAHDHHNQHRLLHGMACHRPGIVYGLEVLAKGGSKIVVAPGIAVDPEGRTIILQAPIDFDLDERGEFYIVLLYEQPELSKTTVNVGGGQKRYGFVEGRKVIRTKELPSIAYIELARAFRTKPEIQIKNASDPFDPKTDEINLLHRKLAFPHCYADMAVGELPYVPIPQSGNTPDWKPNRAGLYNLLLEGSGRGFHLDFAKPATLTDVNLASEMSVLYMAGGSSFQPLSKDQVVGLQQFLASGGTLLADSSTADFTKSFEDLGAQLNASIKKLDKKHPILKSHYVFSAPPPGAVEGGSMFIDESAGIILSTMNYGGSWQGDIVKPEASDARERIRQSVEFGLNILAYAAKRHRMTQLSKI